MGILINLFITYPFLVSAKSANTPIAIGESKDVSLQGVSVYDVNQLWRYAYQSVTKSQKQPTVEEIAKAIKLIYREDGYFLVEVIVKSVGPNPLIIVHEGRISKIEISGASKEIAEKIHGYIEKAVGDGPVTLEKFERGLMLAKDMAGVYLTSEFMSSKDTGDDILKIAVKTVKQRGSLSIDNLPRNFGEGLYAVLSEEIYSSISPGDMLRFNVLPSADFNNQWSGVFGSLTYRAPFGSDGWYGEASVGTGLTRSLYSGSNPTTQNLFQNTVAANFIVGYPILRDTHRFLYTMSEIGYSAIDNSLSGMNDSNASVFRQFLVYSDNYRDGSTFRTGLTVTGGVADLQYYQNQVVSDPSFYHFRLGAGYTAPLSNLSAGLGLRLEATAQATTSSVPITEKYFLGDRTRLRGYGYAELIGDSGIAATAEISQFYQVGLKYLDSVAPFAFFDAGWLKQNTPIPGMINQTPLASIGVGVQTRSHENFSVRSWVGVPLKAGYTTPAYSPAIWIQLTQAW